MQAPRRPQEGRYIIKCLRDIKTNAGEVKGPASRSRAGKRNSNRFRTTVMSRRIAFGRGVDMLQQDLKERGCKEKGVAMLFLTGGL